MAKTMMIEVNTQSTNNHQKQPLRRMATHWIGLVDVDLHGYNYSYLPDNCNLMRTNITKTK